jgi:hypothetical protein
VSPANLGRTVQQAPYHGVRRVGDEGDPADAYVENKADMAPASQSSSANWPRPAEAGNRPELDLTLAGRAGGRMGRSLSAAVFHMG